MQTARCAAPGPASIGKDGAAPSGAHRVEVDAIDGSGAAHLPGAFLLDLDSGQGETHRLHRLHPSPLHRTTTTHPVRTTPARAGRTGARTAHRVERTGWTMVRIVVRTEWTRCAPDGRTTAPVRTG